MLKVNHKSTRSCFTKDGKLKSRWPNNKEAIKAAKHLNQKFPNKDTKLVAYKCHECHYFHLTRKPKGKRNKK